MPSGREETVLPDIGREHVLKVDGESWLIKPRFSVVFALDQVAAELGVVPDVPLSPSQQAALGEAAIAHMLTDEQRAAFETWWPERQTWCASWLLAVWNELRSGEATGIGPDPTPTSFDLGGGSIDPLETS